MNAAKIFSQYGFLSVALVSAHFLFCSKKYFPGVRISCFLFSSLSYKAVLFQNSHRKIKHSTLRKKSAKPSLQKLEIPPQLREMAIHIHAPIWATTTSNALDHHLRNKHVSYLPYWSIQNIHACSLSSIHANFGMSCRSSYSIFFLSEKH